MVGKALEEEDMEARASAGVLVDVSVGHTPRVLMQGRKNSRRRTPSRIPLYSY
jgi:hypothetical protein